MLGDFMVQFINPLLDGNIWSALVLIFMSFWITFCAIITHKSEKLHTCFNNFIAFDTGMLHNQLLKYWSIQRHTLFCVTVRGVFGFCGVTDHVNVYLNMWAELRCLYVFRVSVSSFINLHVILIVLHCWHNHLHKLYIFCSVPL